MSERDEWRGQRVVAQEKLQRNQTLWDGKMRAIRREADPLKPIAEIDIKLLREYANDLALLAEEHYLLTAVINKLDRMIDG